MKHLVIFDLDGTLTPKREHSSDDFIFEILPGIKEKLTSLYELRFLVPEGRKMAVATNQYSRDAEDKEMELFFDWLQVQLPIEFINVATNSEPYRLKPSANMLVELMERFKVTPEETTFIGDDERDKQAAERAGVQYVDRGEFFGQ
jgi:HAD superfamily hydrolase (TIGR01662 family)